MSLVTLERTGRAPFSFEGEQLCLVSSEKTENKEKFERWYELGLFQTTTQGFIAHIAYCSTWPSEKLRHTESLQADSLSLLFESLAAYDPCKHCLLRPERNEDEIKRNGKRNFSTRQALIQNFQSLVQSAADKIHFQEPPTQGDKTRLQLLIPNQLRDDIEQKRGSASFQDVVEEALREWVQRRT